MSEKSLQPPDRPISIEEMQRNWWIAYEWIEVTERQNATRFYIRGLPRQYGDHERAASEFDAARKALQDVGVAKS